jgi:hypothetical protein
MTLPGTTTSQGKATVESPLAPKTAPRPGRVLFWFARATDSASDNAVVTPASIRVAGGMLCTQLGAVIEDIVSWRARNGHFARRSQVSTLALLYSQDCR